MVPKLGERAPIAAAFAIGLLATTFVTIVPGLRFAYESLALHVALESAQGVVALVLCYLMFGRLRQTNHLRDLLLTAAFAAFASTNLFVSALPIAVGGENLGVTTWTAAGLRLVAGVLLAAAATVPDRRLSMDGLLIRTILTGAVVIAVVVVLAVAADWSLSELIDPELSPESSGEPVISGHPVAVTIQVLSAAVMAVAALAFAARAATTGDDLLRWLAAGATLGAFARVNYVLFPSLYTEWFYTGDLLRLGSYLLFLVGAAREIGAYWRGQAEMAVLEERRRMAREIHDGLTQELSFMRSQLDPSRGALPAEMLPHLSAAAERALQESRRAVATLSADSEGASLADALFRAAHDVAAREGVEVSIELGPGAPTRSNHRAELERVVREAVTNAIRHGGASVVRVRLSRAGSSVLVEVRDDGCGFAPDELACSAGFGLRSMRERVEVLGGTFAIESTSPGGTSVAVTIPMR